MEILKNDELLTTDAAARLLGQTASALALQRFEGRGPKFIKYPSGSVRYRRSVLLAYLRDSEVVPKPKKKREARKANNRRDDRSRVAEV